uniref:DUF4139 domain-containing protein n=1 Tax=uncultured Sphingomonas sp. TaxID=158754 RepID=UPI0025D66B9F|nr:hypothetical protein [uncultured Sphingomonas sp.]
MRLAAVLALLLVPLPAAAQSVATSARPDAVKVTVYRNLNRGSEERLSLDWLGGYALISETRTVSLPAGASDLRFEGVAGGIVPQSAIVSGLPEGIVERNRDAFLLSPGTLLDRSLGRRVQLRRTSRATGRVTEEEVVIRSGADGAVVLQTPAGFEALRCSGQAETLVYPEVPSGLSAKPTLSVRVRAEQPVNARVTLSYLATGFDWQANYIARLSADGARADLFAWLTLASTDETSFRDAETSAVAGRLNREDAQVPPSESRPLRLECWPESKTSDVPPIAPPSPPPPPPPAPMLESPAPITAVGDEIVVTGARIVARQEQLGDVKLYRIPEPVTVAANSQKQVALLEQPAVRVRTVYRSQVTADGAGSDRLATRVLLTRNRTAEGLGVPLPAGRVALFGTREGRPTLLGEGSLDDLAVGEDVEIAFDQSPGVRTRLTRVSDDRYELTVFNDSPVAVRHEAELFTGDDRVDTDARLERRNGRPLWAATIPANGSRTLRYGVRR